MKLMRNDVELASNLSRKAVLVLMSRIRELAMKEGHAVAFRGAANKNKKNLELTLTVGNPGCAMNVYRATVEPETENKGL